MAKISSILRSAQDDRLMFWCPGCDGPHMVGVGPGDGPRWSWNSDVDKPTFNPSVLVTGMHWVPPVTPENAEQFRADPWVQQQAKSICHSFVQEGRMVFLADCTHELAGFTVDIPPFPEGWE